MKGLSQIVIVILILLLVVFISSLAFIWFTAVFAEISEVGKNQTNITTQQMTSSIIIESISQNKIYLRNTGNNDVTNFTVYINDTMVNITSPDVIKPGELGIIIILTEIQEGLYKIKITANYAETEIWWSISKVSETGGPGPSGPVCGNDVCESGETYGNCPQDCQFIKVCKDGSCDSTTIQGGIDLAPSGYKVKIMDGATYSESVKINKNNITLDCNDATINPGRYYDGIYITGSHNIIENCIITNSKNGIYTFGVNGHHNTIQNNLISNSMYHIRLQSFNNIVQNNEMNSSSNHAVVNMFTNVIRNNVISDCVYGLGIGSWAIDSTIENNVITSCNYGIYLSESAYNHIVNNNIACGNLYGDIYCLENRGHSGTGNTADKVDCPGISYESC
ncbi:MAG: NosD domain-containing protein [Candidatus Aenigmatarchaeota archaeon]